MIIGVCGAPFTGKSKMAEELAKKLRYKVQTYDYKLFYENNNLEPESVGNIIERLNVQSEIVNTMCTRLNEIIEDNVIFDGTPLDALSYLIADISSQNIYPFKQNKKIADFVHHAITGMKEEIVKSMMSKFEFLIVCHPKELTKRAYDENKFNQDFKMHIGYVTNGLLSTLPINSIFLTDPNPCFEKDVKFILEHIDKYSETQKKKFEEHKVTLN